MTRRRSICAWCSPPWIMDPRLTHRGTATVTTWCRVVYWRCNWSRHNMIPYVSLMIKFDTRRHWWRSSEEMDQSFSVHSRAYSLWFSWAANLALSVLLLRREMPTAFTHRNSIIVPFTFSRLFHVVLNDIWFWLELWWLSVYSRCTIAINRCCTAADVCSVFEQCFGGIIYCLSLLFAAERSTIRRIVARIAGNNSVEWMRLNRSDTNRSLMPRTSGNSNAAWSIQLCIHRVLLGRNLLLCIIAYGDKE